MVQKYIIAFWVNADIHSTGSNDETTEANIAATKKIAVPISARITLCLTLRLSVLKPIYFFSNSHAVRNPTANPALLANDEIECIGSYKIFPAVS